MQNTDLKKLIKIESRIMQLAEEFGLKTCPIEWDVVPDQKMLEIMAYHLPVNISSWKYGRNYERLRTIHENVHAGLPYEVVINSDPCRAYLMKSNTFPVQCLVMAHVIGHNAFFTMSKYFTPTRKDILELMMRASERLNDYERKYGIDEVEMIVDAGHALQFHSSPFDNETEEDKRNRVFEAAKRKIHNPTPNSEFNDIFPKKEDFKIDIELFNQNLWRNIRTKTPIEPTSDLLRYIIDNSPILEDWHKDILEILRREGRYLWPQMVTRYMNEGFATFWHQKIMDRLFDENLLSTSEHAQYNYSNALVKSKNALSMNPYHIGCEMWEDIVDRWDKGKHGNEYNLCLDKQTKKEWNKKDGMGIKKMFEIMQTHTDWFFMQEFLTPQLVADLELFVFVIRELQTESQIVVTKHVAEQIRDLIVATFSHSQIPKVEIINGDYKGRKEMLLEHKHVGADLDRKYSEETMKHIYRLWGNIVYLKSKEENNDIILKCSNGNDKPLPMKKPNPVTSGQVGRVPVPTPINP